MTERRARLRGATFRRSSLWREDMRPTPEQYADLLNRAAAGLDAFGHRPAYDGQWCEDCGRPDWEVAGDCLARVRAAANRLGRLAVHLDTMEAALVDLVRSRVEVSLGVADAIRGTREILAAQGITAAAHLAWVAEERERRLAARRVRAGGKT